MTRRFDKKASKDGRRFSGFSGRPSLVPDGHGAWKNADNGYSRNMTQNKLGMCERDRSPIAAYDSPESFYDPRPIGLNPQIVLTDKDASLSLYNIGYHYDLLTSLLKFQADWNFAVRYIYSNHSLGEAFDLPVQGKLNTIGILDYDTARAIETAVHNQEASGVRWHDAVHEISTRTDSRTKVYNAAEGKWYR